MEFGDCLASHQIKGFQKCGGRTAFAYLMEQGTGKTRLTIYDALDLFNNGLIKGVLIVAPNGVHANWVDELREAVPNHINLTEPFVWQSDKLTNKTYIKNLDSFINIPTDKLKIFCMNIDALNTDKGVNSAAYFLRRRPCMMVVDESTKIKTPKADRTKTCVKLGALAEYRRILNGTPVTQSPFDIYAQFAFLDRKITGHWEFTTFKSEYGIFQRCYRRPDPMKVAALNAKYKNDPDKLQKAIDALSHYDDLVEYKNLDRLAALIEPYSYRVTKAECLDLPPKIYQKRIVELSKPQRAAYNRMRDQAISQWEHDANSGIWTVASGMTLLMRLHQIAGGFGPVDRGDGMAEFTDPLKPNAKLAALLDVVEQVSGKAIIWAAYRQEIKLIVETLREIYGQDAVVEYHGGIADKQLRAENEKTMRVDYDGPARFLVGSTSSGGVGLNMQGATTQIYYSNTFKAYDRWQSEDRSHRMGVLERCLYIDLIAEGTVDFPIIGCLKEKANLADKITGDNPRRWF